MKFKHWIVFILLGLIWSTSFLWIKIGVQEIGPMALVAFRTLFGAITVLVIALYQKEQWPRDRKTWRNFAILGPTSLAIPFFLISWGEQTIDSAVASILNATAPFIEKPFQIPTLPLTWVAALWLGILGTGLAVLMFYYLIHEIGPTRATLVTYLFPIGGVFFGVVFLHEYLSWQLLMGTFLIVGSLVVVNWKPAERMERKQVALKSR
jgi:drug/metabolite transporter (DMT)-like permease